MSVEAPTKTVPRPDLLDEEQTTTDDPGDHVVIVWDNDHNTAEEVVEILMKATNCPLEEAVNETWEVHNLGKSLVHHGSKQECQRAARIIRTIGIKVTVDQV